MNRIEIQDRLNELAIKCTVLADLFSGLPQSGLCKDTPHGIFLIMMGIVRSLRQLNNEIGKGPAEGKI
jgi:hypothetical protein